ncbi:Ig-like domain-containing protein [Anoxynatronum buryatiense]|uniref:Ig-like domain (Group 2) n=1 Tax=Anoxynatronum buryatiense TaxID=489973 RepID=A0AA45WY05_9CLOT|nr:Ig-like domain-containing protein [Anoxynatronum buryatiense]SMP65238.1 Ig-like domain (group 2) [Anoxynatronum buryatiense]
MRHLRKPVGGIVLLTFTTMILFMCVSMMDLFVHANIQITMKPGEVTRRGVSADPIRSIESSNTDVATGSVYIGDGFNAVEIRAHAPGQAQIKAYYPGSVDTYTIVVEGEAASPPPPEPPPEPEPEPEPPPEPQPQPEPQPEPEPEPEPEPPPEPDDFSIVIQPGELQMETVGSIAQLNALVEAPGVAFPAVYWESSNQQVVQVDQSGRVTATGVGTASVSASLEQAFGVKDAIQVTVGNIPIESIVFHRSAVCISAGQSLNVTYTVVPDNATEKLQWRTRDRGVAYVSSESTSASGTVRITAGMNPSDVQITAFVDRNNRDVDLAVLQVAVMPRAERVELQVGAGGTYLSAPNQNYQKAGFFLKPGESVWLDAIIFPNETLDKSVSWTSSNPGAVSLGTPQEADLYIDTSRRAAVACLQQTAGRRTNTGRFYPRMLVTAQAVADTDQSVIRAVTANGLSAEITINVATDDYLTLWENLEKISSEKELREFMLNRRLTRLPPILKDSLIWKIKDYDPSGVGTLLNIALIQAGGDSWASLIKELVVAAIGYKKETPAAQAADHAMGFAFGDDWLDRFIGMFYSEPPPYDPTVDLRKNP